MAITTPSGGPAGGALVRLLHENPRAAGRLVHAAVWTDEALALLGGCGWNDGGCVLLTSALSRLLAGQAHRTVALLGRGPWAQHALVEVALDGGAWCLDSDGAATRDEVLHHWRTVERVSDPILVELDDALIHPETPRDPDLADRVAAYLGDRLAAATGVVSS